MAIAGLLGGMLDLPASTLTEDALLARLTDMLRVRASVEELTARLIRSVVDRDVSRIAGASSARSWLSGTHGMSAAEAARLVAEAAVCDTEPCDGACTPTRRAWATGDLTAERAVLVGEAVDAIGADVPAADTAALQRDLIALSPTLGYSQLRQVCRHSVEVVAPDRADQILEASLQASEQRARRASEVWFKRIGDGATRFAGRLPDLHADMLRAAIDAHAAPRRRGRLTDEDTDTDEELTYPQRQGRGLLELIEHLPTTELPQHGGGNATIVITTSLDALRAGLGHAVLDTGTELSIGEVRRLACNASLVPAVLGGDSAVLDLGLGRRLFDRYQRLALALRDKGCVFPGCDRPPTSCEGHHITTWAQGGPTDLANGCLLCPFHHHLVHAGEWAVRMATNGVPEIVPPARIDPDRKSIRHQRLAPRRC
jgi:hypothetical protein